MATVSRERARELLDLAMEDVAMAYAGHVRGITETDKARRSLGDLYTLLGLGDPPEFEPEVKLRRVS